MENGSINNIEGIPEEQNSVSSDERNKPVERLFRFLMSAGVLAALAGFLYASFWFMNNSGL